jgi:hypothetical protein
VSVCMGLLACFLKVTRIRCTGRIAWRRFAATRMGCQQVLAAGVTAVRSSCSGRLPTLCRLLQGVCAVACMQSGLLSCLTPCPVHDTLSCADRARRSALNTMMTLSNEDEGAQNEVGGGGGGRAWWAAVPMLCPCCAHALSTWMSPPGGFHNAHRSPKLSGNSQCLTPA